METRRNGRKGGGRDDGAAGGGPVTLARLAALAALLVAPGWMVVRLSSWVDARLLCGYLAAIGLLTLGLYWEDKRRARGAGWRVPEATLHLAELLGGWPVAFLAQGWLRHKVAKVGYQVVFWAIVALHETVAVDYLLGGRLVQAVLAAA